MMVRDVGKYYSLLPTLGIHWGVFKFGSMCVLAWTISCPDCSIVYCVLTMEDVCYLWNACSLYRVICHWVCTCVQFLKIVNFKAEITSRHGINSVSGASWLTRPWQGAWVKSSIWMPSLASGKNVWQLFWPLTFNKNCYFQFLHALLAVSMPNILLVNRVLLWQRDEST